MSFDLNLLPILFAVYETKNVGDAAQRLGMSQPGLSTALKRARLALADPLFLRTSQGMEPTARTRELIEPVRHILTLVDKKITAPPNFDPSAASTEFRLAMSDVGEAIYLPQVMRHLSCVAPKVTVGTVPCKRRVLEQALEEGKVDLAIGFYPNLQSADMVEQFIATTSFMCIARALHPVEGDSLDIDEFCNSAHLTVDADGRTIEVFEAHLKRLKIQRRIMLRTSHFMSIPSIVANTDLLAVVPTPLGDFLIKQGTFKRFKVPFDMPAYDLKMHWHRTAHHDPRHIWLRQTFLHKLRNIVSMEPIFGP